MTGTKTYQARTLRPRTLQEIAEEIADDWDDCPSEIDDLLDGLRLSETIYDIVHERTAGDLVRDFLRLSKDWTGNTAKRVRHELRGKLGLA